MRYWVDDRLVEAEEARVSVLDHGFTVADGVFETLKVVAGTPFALSRHLRRLATSAAGLGLPAPVEALVREAVGAVCAANADEVGQLGRLRITCSAGPAPLGQARLGHDPRRGRGSRRALALSCGQRRADAQRRSAVVGLKTTSYAENVVALAAARRRARPRRCWPTPAEACEGTGATPVAMVRERSAGGHHARARAGVDRRAGGDPARGGAAGGRRGVPHELDA
jgi:branched-chain amino acid aminotransferase